MGFDQSLFVEPVDENILCGICHEVLDRPVVACVKGHTYCHECLEEAKERFSTCPCCRGQLLESAAASLPLQNMIASLKMRCGAAEEKPPAKKKLRSSSKKSNRKRKEDCCQWQGPVSEYKQHKRTCEYTEKECPLGCHKTFRASVLDDHVQNECEKRLVKCEFCEKEMKACHVDHHHIRHCPNVKIPCVFCGQQDFRRNLGDYVSRAEHYQGPNSSRFTGHYITCPKLPVDCEFYDYGCRAELSRETIAAHHAEQAQYHAGLVRQELDNVNRRMTCKRMDIRWNIPTSKLAGNTACILKSSPVEIEGHEMFLKLYLGPQDDAVSISICAEAIDCVCKIEDVRIDVLDDEADYYYTFFRYKDEWTLRRIHDEADIEFTVPKAKSESQVSNNNISHEGEDNNNEDAESDDSDEEEEDSDQDNGDEEEGSDDGGHGQEESDEVELTRSELINRAHEGQVVISADFLIQRNATIKNVECR